MDIREYIGLASPGRPIVLFLGMLIRAFGRKRKKRFEQDGRIPFGEWIPQH